MTFGSQPVRVNFNPLSVTTRAILEPRACVQVNGLHTSILVTYMYVPSDLPICKLTGQSANLFDIVF